MAIITISRQFGAGGSTVARLLAEELGAELVDESLIAEVARRLDISAPEVAKTDERPKTLVDRLLVTLTYLTPESRIAWQSPYGDVMIDPRSAIENLTQDVIRDVARLGNAVIVGRGGAFILRNHPNAFHVFLQAPGEVRVTTIMTRLLVDQETARRRIRETDANRAAYIRQLYDADWRDSANFDLVINTGRVGFARAVDLILAAIGYRSAVEPKQGA